MDRVEGDGNRISLLGQLPELYKVVDDLLLQVVFNHSDSGVFSQIDKKHPNYKDNNDQAHENEINDHNPFIVCKERGDSEGSHN